jgi:hypothetical protein
LLVASLGSTILRKHLDAVPLWRGDNVAVRQLVDDFARYLYLPRVASPEVLLKAIRDGFGYAEGYEDAPPRYRGLHGGHVVSISSDSAGFLVKPDVAGRQLDAEAPPPATHSPFPGDGDGNVSPCTGTETHTQFEPVPQVLRRFHGAVRLDSTRVGRDAGRIADEVIAHLSGQMGAEVIVTIEIEARLPNGATDPLMRTVTENSRTLKFDSFGFERD